MGHNTKDNQLTKNLRKLAENRRILLTSIRKTIADIFKDIKDYIYLNGEKIPSPKIYHLSIFFSFVTLKNEILDFLGWPLLHLRKN